MTEFLCSYLKDNYDQPQTIFHLFAAQVLGPQLITRPLWRRDIHWLHNWWRLGLSGQSSCQLSEGSLVAAHSHSEGLEVVQLVGETDSVTVNEHEVASLVGELVHLEDTLAQHGLLSLHEQVLAETHRPAGTDSSSNASVLVGEAVDLVDGVVHLDRGCGKDGRHLIRTSADALSLLHLPM